VTRRLYGDITGVGDGFTIRPIEIIARGEMRRDVSRSTSIRPLTCQRGFTNGEYRPGLTKFSSVFLAVEKRKTRML
jgi:hypothetical protein